MSKLIRVNINLDNSHSLNDFPVDIYSGTTTGNTTNLILSNVTTSPVTFTVDDNINEFGLKLVSTGCLDQVLLIESPSVDCDMCADFVEYFNPSATPNPTDGSTPAPTPNPSATPNVTPDATPNSTPNPSATPNVTPDATPNSTPNPTDGSTPAPTPNPSATPPPTYEPTPIPSSTPDATPTPTPSATENCDFDVDIDIATPTPTPTSSDEPGGTADLQIQQCGTETTYYVNSTQWCDSNNLSMRTGNNRLGDFVQFRIGNGCGSGGKYCGEIVTLLPNNLVPTAVISKNGNVSDCSDFNCFE